LSEGFVAVAYAAGEEDIRIARGRLAGLIDNGS
jgi:hypothetical protein